jgi:hypothetical protein
MPDIEERLSTDLDAAVARIDVPTKPPAGLVARVRRSRQRRFAAAGAAGALAVVLATVTLTNSTDLGRQVRTGPASDAESKFPAPPELSVDVVPLPESPLGSRIGASGVWTGSEFVVWGGAAGTQVASSAFGDGAAYDPATQRWRLLPPGPLSPRAGHVAVWTGDEMIVWGGSPASAGIGAVGQLRDGAAYNPSTNAWRRIADAPGERSEGKGVVVDNYLVVGAGVTSQASDLALLLVYDISSDAWSTMPLELGRTARVYDLASAGSGVAVAMLESGRSGSTPRFLHVEIPSGRVQMSPDLTSSGKVSWLGVAWTGEQVVALTLGDGGPTSVRLWRPGASQWSDTSDVPRERLQPRAGTYWHEAGAIQWFDGWLVSVGSIGVFVAAPGSAETAIPKAFRTPLRRLCGGEAAIAFSDDSVFVWGGQECSAQSANAGGQVSVGTRVMLRPTPGG